MSISRVIGVYRSPMLWTVLSRSSFRKSKIFITNLVPGYYITLLYVDSRLCIYTHYIPKVVWGFHWCVMYYKILKKVWVFKLFLFRRLDISTRNQSWFLRWKIITFLERLKKKGIVKGCKDVYVYVLTVYGKVDLLVPLSGCCDTELVVISGKISKTSHTGKPLFYCLTS